MVKSLTVMKRSMLLIVLSGSSSAELNRSGDN